MHVSYKNINDAFAGLVYGFANPLESSRQWRGVNPERCFPVTKRTSRNGDVLMIEEPIIVTYERPRERVLFNQARDANPFFHLYESLWMLAGRNDVEPLAYYASNIRNYSDDGETLNGAYGHRWKHVERGFPNDHLPPVDQLKLLIQHLKAKPDSRRAVLEMWNVEDDLLKIDSSKDVCCNLSALFSIREIPCPRCMGAGDEPYNNPDTGKIEYGSNALCQNCDDCLGQGDLRYLDMTVFNRSNDLIWGMLGANAVHFSVLQEYMAAHLGVEVGVYNQVSNNLHVYLNEHWKPEQFLEEYKPEKNLDLSVATSKWKHFPLVKDPAVFDKEVVELVEQHKDGNDWHDGWQEPFLNEVAQPMLSAFHSHKVREYKFALEHCEDIKADDWRYAATKWVNKRAANYAMKSHVRND